MTTPSRARQSRPSRQEPTPDDGRLDRHIRRQLERAHGRAHPMVDPLPRRRRGACRSSGSVAGSALRAARAARRLPRVRSAAGDDPDRGAGLCARAGRADRHPAHRGGGQRRAGRRIPALRIRLWAVRRRRYVRKRRRSGHHPPRHFRAPRHARRRAAHGRGAAEADAAHLEHHGRPQVRAVCRTRSIPTRCATSPTGRSSRTCWRCRASRA